MTNSFIARFRAHLSSSTPRKPSARASQTIPRRSTRKYWESRISNLQSLPSFNKPTENTHDSENESSNINAPHPIPRTSSSRKHRGSSVHTVNSLPPSSFSTPDKPIPHQLKRGSAKNQSAHTLQTRSSSSRKPRGSKKPSSLSTSKLHAPSPAPGAHSWHTQSSPSQKPSLQYRRAARKAKLPKVQSLQPSNFPLPETPKKHPSSQGSLNSGFPQSKPLAKHPSHRSSAHPTHKQSSAAPRRKADTGCTPQSRSRVLEVDSLPIYEPLISAPAKPPSNESRVDPSRNESSVSPKKANTGAPQSRKSRVPKVHSLPPSHFPKIKTPAASAHAHSIRRDTIPQNSMNESPKNDLLPQEKIHIVHDHGISPRENGAPDRSVHDDDENEALAGQRDDVVSQCNKPESSPSPMSVSESESQPTANGPVVPKLKPVQVASSCKAKHRSLPASRFPDVSVPSSPRPNRSVSPVSPVLSLSRPTSPLPRKIDPQPAPQNSAGSHRKKKTESPTAVPSGLSASISVPAIGNARPRSHRKRKSESSHQPHAAFPSELSASVSVPTIGTPRPRSSSTEAAATPTPISSPIPWNRRVFSLTRSILPSPSRSPPLSRAASCEQILLPSEVPLGNSKPRPARIKSPATASAPTADVSSPGAGPSSSSPAKRRLRSFNRRLFNRSSDIAELELFPLEKARVYVKAAEAAVKVGHLESAELHLRNSLRYYRRAADSDTDTDNSTSGTDIDDVGMEMEWAECIALLGIVLERRGHAVEAEDVLKESARRLDCLEPELALVPLCVLGRLFSKSGRYKEAREVKMYVRNGGRRKKVTLQ